MTDSSSLNLQIAPTDSHNVATDSPACERHSGEGNTFPVPSSQQVAGSVLTSPFPSSSFFLFFFLSIHWTQNSHLLCLVGRRDSGSVGLELMPHGDNIVGFVRALNPGYPGSNPG